MKTQKEAIDRIKNRFFWGGAKAALEELDDLRYSGYLSESQRQGVKEKTLKFIGMQLKKNSPCTVYTQPIEGYVFTNNLSYAIENDIRKIALDYNWDWFTLVVEGEEICWANINHKDSVIFTPDWWAYPQDLAEASQ